MKSKYIQIVILLVLSNIYLFSQGFLKVSGQNIVDGSGKTIILKGTGLGNWLVPEGYMMLTSGFANSPTDIKNKILSTVSPTKTEEFYKTYRKNYCTEQDIKALKEWGFNSVRLPMHYNLMVTKTNPWTYIDEGFMIIDSLLSWCKKYEIYLILDLHCAPGGQSDENISDYIKGQPSLWEDPLNKQITVDLWKTLANRYKNEEWIGGYDLLNETKWNFGGGNKPLRDLMIEITNAIRTVDNNHIVYIEGNWFATDFTDLTPAWDDNLVYSFHKYWNNTTQATIEYLLSLRKNANRPLWLGESGENSNEWFAETIEMLESNNIGWSWWPHKKLDSNSGLLSVKRTTDYDVLLKYWDGTGAKPTEDYAFTALMRIAENSKFENCLVNTGVIDAMIRQPFSNETVPFKQNEIPGTVYFSDYDMGRHGYAYKDNDYINISGSAGGSPWNLGYSFRNDGVDLEKCNDFFTNGYSVGWINTGEFLTYTVDVKQSGDYNVVLRYAASNSTGRLQFKVDNNNVGSLITMNNTGGWANWSDLTVNGIPLTEGKHQISTHLYFGGFNLNSMSFEYKGVSNDETETPIDFNLGDNYPNPFNPETIIEYSLPERGQVTLTIYDVLGREVLVPFMGEQEKGHHFVTVNSSSLSSGTYFYTLKAGNRVASKKCIVLK